MPKHDFLLLPETGGDYSQYGRFLNDPRAIKLDDDLVWYIRDTLEWIPSTNPANRGAWKGHGLNLCGPTVINTKGAASAEAIFGLWAALFAQGPARLELTGLWSCVEGSPVETGHYETLEFERDSLVTSMRTIADYAKQTGTGEFYILHLGI